LGIKPRKMKKVIILSMFQLLSTKLLGDKNKIYHLNFSELISDGKISLNVNSYLENDPGSHLNNNFHANIFTKKIIEKLK